MRYPCIRIHEASDQMGISDPCLPCELFLSILFWMKTERNSFNRYWLPCKRREPWLKHILDHLTIGSSQVGSQRMSMCRRQCRIVAISLKLHLLHASRMPEGSDSQSTCKLKSETLWMSHLAHRNFQLCLEPRMSLAAQDIFKLIGPKRAQLTKVICSRRPHMPKIVPKTL